MDLALLALLFVLLNVDKAPMDHVSFHNVFRNGKHKMDVPIMSDMEDTRNADDVFSMHLDRHIRRMVSLIIACFVTSAVGVGVDLLLRDVAFDLADPDRLGPLGLASFFKVLPKVAVRHGFPIASVFFARLEMTQNPARSVNQRLAVSAYMDWPIGCESDDCSSNLSSCRAASVSTDGGVQHEPTRELLKVRELTFSRAKSLIYTGVPARPPNTCSPKAQVLLEGIYPTTIRIDVDVGWSWSSTSIR